MNCSIGVDIGGTNIKIIIKSELEYKRYSLKTSDFKSGLILDGVSEFIIDYISNSIIEFVDIKSIVIAVPGPVVDNVVLFCVNLSWGKVRVVDRMKELLPFTTNIFCVNDANACLYSEIMGMEEKCVVLLTLGTGIGGAYYNDGIIEGSTGSVGEFGHINIDSKYNFKCNCGLSGCLETVASATGIEAVYKSKTNGFCLSCEEIFSAALLLEKNALETIEELYENLGKVLSMIALTLNPDVFIIAGGVSSAGSCLIDGIKKYYEKYSFNSVRDTKIIKTSLGSYSGAIGAMLYGEKKRKCIIKSKI